MKPTTDQPEQPEGYSYVMRIITFSGAFQCSLCGEQQE
jgi:hypothetical protein